MGPHTMDSALATAAPQNRSCGRPRNRQAQVHADPAPAPRGTRLGPATTLAVYRHAGTDRELLAIARPDASTLLLDTRAGSLADARVVAHLSADEPSTNAVRMVDMYLSDTTRGRCRRLQLEDLAELQSAQPRIGAAGVPQSALIDAAGVRYAIRALALRPDRHELRWTRSYSPASQPQHLTLREVIGTLEEYEPARAMTVRTVTAPVPESARVSHLGLELARLLRSPVILNRGLREAVARHVHAGASMSEIAIRCGRFKRDRNGHRSGETSWLARRIGQMPEGGQAHPTSWIHSDTLALIAREGLGLSPHEVEL